MSPDHSERSAGSRPALLSGLRLGGNLTSLDGISVATRRVAGHGNRAEPGGCSRDACARLRNVAIGAPISFCGLLHPPDSFWSTRTPRSDRTLGGTMKRYLLQHIDHVGQLGPSVRLSGRCAAGGRPSLVLSAAEQASDDHRRRDTPDPNDSGLAARLIRFWRRRRRLASG